MDTFFVPQNPFVFKGLSRHLANPFLDSMKLNLTQKKKFMFFKYDFTSFNFHISSTILLDIVD